MTLRVATLLALFGGIASPGAAQLVADETAIENLPVPGRTIMGRVVVEGFNEPLTSVLVRALQLIDRHGRLLSGW